MRRLVIFAAAFALASCAVIKQPSTMLPQWTTEWRQVVTKNDEERLRDWRKTFVAALDTARKAGHSTEIAREGPLLEPDSALDKPMIPNGIYRCRVIKLGAKAAGNLDFVSYAGFTCRIRAEQNLQRLRKLNGSQRYVGIIFPDDAMREVFLGTVALGDEQRAMQYGQDETRDVAGFIERIGPNRWRLLMPQPHFESQLDVMELAPTNP